MAIYALNVHAATKGVERGVTCLLAHGKTRTKLAMLREELSITLPALTTG